MASSAQIWQCLAQILADQKPAVLVIVVESLGSAPGKLGAKMAVTCDAVIGTVGGGVLEYAALHKARDMLSLSSTSPQWIQRAHVRDHPRASGGVCGGEQTVLLYRCLTAESALFQTLADAAVLNEPRLFTLSKEGAGISAASCADPAVCYTQGDAWQYRELCDRTLRAYIVGAGHVGQALAKVLDLLDFKVTLIDERPLAILSQHSDMTWPYMLMAYDDIDSAVPEGSNHYVFIMTHGHQRDALVCAKLLPRHFAYVGVLGSQTKVAQLKASLLKQLPETCLQRLHAPMGLAINSHSPAEIAVSIGAELVQILGGGFLPDSIYHQVNNP